MAEEVKATEATEATKATSQVEPTAAAQEAPKASPTQEQAQPFKAFATEEEFNNFLKSTSSKAKNEILKALETNSVDEGKEKLSQAEQLQKDLQTAVTRLTQLEEENVVVKLGVNDEFREEALTLARAKVSDQTSLSKALEEVTKKFPNLTKGTQAQGDKIEKIGGDKTDSKPAVTDSVKENLKKKYPWLQNI